MDDGISEKAELCRLLGGQDATMTWLQLLDNSDAAGFERSVGRIDDPATRLCALAHAGRHYARGDFLSELQTSFLQLTAKALADYQRQLTPLRELVAVTQGIEIMRYNDAGGTATVDTAIIGHLTDRMEPRSTMTGEVRHHTQIQLCNYLDERKTRGSLYKAVLEGTKAHLLQNLCNAAIQPYRERGQAAHGDIGILLPFGARRGPA